MQKVITMHALLYTSAVIDYLTQRMTVTGAGRVEGVKSDDASITHN
jgi:hypothetical protein